MAATKTQKVLEPSQELLKKLTEPQRRLYRRIPESIDYIDHPDFAKQETAKSLFGPEATEIDVPAWSHFPESLDDVPQGRSKRNALKPKEEAHLFLQYNYARYRLASLLEQQTHEPTVDRAVEMTRWYGRALEKRSSLVRANMALVLAMAKRTRIPNVEFTELVSEGNMGPMPR